jgi:hypothetical protein
VIANTPDEGELLVIIEYHFVRLIVIADNECCPIQFAIKEVAHSIGNAAFTSMAIPPSSTREVLNQLPTELAPELAHENTK